MSQPKCMTNAVLYLVARKDRLACHAWLLGTSQMQNAFGVARRRGAAETIFAAKDINVGSINESQIAGGRGAPLRTHF